MQKEPPKSPKRQYDDPELNDILMKLALDPTVTMLVTLDKSQAGGNTSTESITLLCSIPTSPLDHIRPCVSSQSANRPRTKLAIPKGSSRTGKL